jgi:cytochrome c oxidase cbb3-type subunit 3
VDDLTYTINNARFGVMPNWNQRLSEADIRSVALYVHGLGGGE